MGDNPESGGARPAGAPLLVLLGILFAIVLAGIDGTVVGTIMPVAVHELGGEALYPWAFAAYMLATAATMPMWGPGSDRWGRRRTFLAGIAVFVLGSLFAGIAPTMPLFVAARALQGIGAGALFSLPFIVLAVVYPPERRARALGVVASAWALSSVAGPALGTALVSFASWRWVFVVNLPVGLLAASLILRSLEESHGDRDGAFDLAGSLLAAGGGTALVAAALGVAGSGPAGFALAAAGLALLAAFLRNERRAAAPVLPLSFFRSRGFAAGTAAAFVGSFTAFGLMAFLPLEVERAHGSAAAVGLVVGVFSVGWSAAALGSGRLVHRLGERLFASTGMAVLAAGLLALAAASGSGAGTVAAAAGLAGIGMGIMTPALTVSIQNAVPLRRMGSAVASLQFLRQIGAALGVGALGLAVRSAGFVSGLRALAVFVMLGLAAALALPRTSLEEAPRAPVEANADTP